MRVQPVPCDFRKAAGEAAVLLLLLRFDRAVLRVLLWGGPSPRERQQSRANVLPVQSKPRYGSGWRPRLPLQFAFAGAADGPGAAQPFRRLGRFSRLRDRGCRRCIGRPRGELGCKSAHPICVGLGTLYRAVQIEILIPSC